MAIPIVLVAAAALVALGAVIARRPSAFTVSRSTHIQAPAAAVFQHVNDFHRWDAWSPWAKLDPSMTTRFEGAPAGTGAVYSWEGNRKVGAGRMEVLDSVGDERIRIGIDFLRPFKANNLIEFTFAPDGTGTRVTWTMSGENKDFMSKAFAMFVDMDKLVGRDFEKGLASMKAVAETAATHGR
jgi:uncharacterized protein YndB with AHSA1/START domain